TLTSRPWPSITYTAGVWSTWPWTTWDSIPYSRQTRFSFASGPVRKYHWLINPWSSEYARTSETAVAVGLASTPSSCTCWPAAPSSRLAFTISAVVSGHTPRHSESLNARITALPRNDASEVGVPNWLTSVKPGAWRPGSVVPGST